MDEAGWTGEASWQIRWNMINDPSSNVKNLIAVKRHLQDIDLKLPLMITPPLKPKSSQGQFKFPYLPPTPPTAAQFQAVIHTPNKKSPP